MSLSHSLAHMWVTNRRRGHWSDTKVHYSPAHEGWRIIPQWKMIVTAYEKKKKWKAKKHMWKSSCLKSTCRPVSMQFLHVCVLCWCRCMQSVRSVLSNDEGAHYRHGNLAHNKTVPVAASHPVVIFWKLPFFFFFVALTHRSIYLCVKGGLQS